MATIQKRKTQSGFNYSVRFMFQGKRQVIGLGSSYSKRQVSEICRFIEQLVDLAITNKEPDRLTSAYLDEEKGTGSKFCRDTHNVSRMGNMDNLITQVPFFSNYYSSHPAAKPHTEGGHLGRPERCEFSKIVAEPPWMDTDEHVNIF